MATVAVKRVYEPPASSDGARVLVDRIWPRGISKRTAKLDLWLKDIAPSTELRKWFGHDPSRFKEFTECYRRELSVNADDIGRLLEISSRSDLTLLYAARNRQVNHAIVLADFLADRGVHLTTGSAC